MPQNAQNPLQADIAAHTTSLTIEQLYELSMVNYAVFPPKFCVLKPISAAIKTASYYLI